MYDARANATYFADEFQGWAGDIAQFMVPQPGRIWEGSWVNWCTLFDK